MSHTLDWAVVEDARDWVKIYSTVEGDRETLLEDIINFHY